MTFEEIVEKLKELPSQQTNWRTVTHKDLFNECNFPNPLPSVGEWKEVAKHGGEGEGERYWSVKHFIEHNIYIKLNGYYTSYDGVDFSHYEYEEVVPKEKTIIVFETKTK